MFGFFARRLVYSLLVVLLVSFVSFVLFSVIGDPVSNIIGQETNTNDRTQIRSKLGLDDPFFMQYFAYLKNAASGNFGLSLRLKEPVMKVVLGRLPATIELVFLSAIIGIFVGFPLGCLFAFRPKSIFVRIVSNVALLGISIPTFVVAITLIYFFSVEMRWFPSSGRHGVTKIGFWSTSLLTQDGWRSTLLPAITLSLFQISTNARLLGRAISKTLNEEFIRFAYARGHSELSIYLNHVVRNSVVSTIDIIGINVGNLIAFAVVTETIFQWPGIGFLFIQSVEFADIPVLALYLSFVAILFLVISLIIDLLSMLIDPRLRPGQRA
jgi:peptide/nickel transport system permease protein